MWQPPLWIGKTYLHCKDRQQKDFHQLKDSSLDLSEHEFHLFCYIDHEHEFFNL